MGWWGIVTREDVPREEWRTNRLEDIQTRYGGQRVVAVDCHI
ncbi:hypothetical protein CEDDRAFT_04355 [Frankia sp. CeD]|nr:hypothetical protein CEDDRAFT_04355 [Frankia sp. CeD]